MSAHPLFDVFPDFATLPASEQQELVSGLQPVGAPKGHILFQPGDSCRAFLFVTDGSVQVRLLEENGHCITLYRVERGETCVLTTTCLMAQAPYAAEGIVETDCRGYMLSPSAFQHLLDTSRGFRNFVFSAFGNRLTEMMMLVNEVAFRRLDQRLAQWLLRQSGPRIAATHQLIADELGSAREVISRQLKEFERQGWVELERGSILCLNRQAIENVSNSAQNANVT